MRDLRIVFMGTPEFAVTILNGLLEEEYNVVGVITAPDRPAGRGQKVRESDVKAFAKARNLNILQPTNLKSEDFLKELKELNANLQIVVAFRMLPEAVWKMPAYGTFNLHASLLPQYRGAAPINWAIINGETETGVTTFFIDEKIDTGEIILQEKLAIDDKENAGVLHDRLMIAGKELVVKTVKAIAIDEVSTFVQDSSRELKTAYKLHSENTRIDWDAPLQDIYNHIRGLSPYPAAYTMLENGGKEQRVKIYSAFAKAEKEMFIPSGAVTQVDDHLAIATPEGYICITEIQLSGKKKMAVKDLLNGYKFDKNAKMR
ncbi:methionyl-tRNA formyltransferase [Dokdonia sp. Hel_I_63]|uniref:methionyl-tRNA formyltransferase n=1 Tax=Dokdonia sp. Hel_I_63 TaxID=1249996 RepID=UPI00119A8D6B|nr:methionyl-tRNA formyltransferase [Dokdonia sp. Hel_I_63]TVZ23622.1 methionyl-tRNA formyltransferase [Dokdonia sp. Hel_I_63]